MDLWRVTRRMLDGVDDSGSSDSSLGNTVQKDCETQSRYFEMEHVFWVRVSPTEFAPMLNGFTDVSSYLTSWISLLIFRTFMDSISSSLG